MGIMIVGSGNRIEIWNKAGWDAMNSALSDDLIRAAAQEIGLGGVG